MEVKIYKTSLLFKIVIGALLVGLVFLIWKISQVNKEGGEGRKIEMVKITPTPTLIPMNPGGYGPDASGAAILMEEEKRTEKYYPLFSRLPYEEKGVKISHYYKPLNLAVYVDLKLTSKEEAVKVVQNFLKANGFSPYSHEIDWRYENQ